MLCCRTLNHWIEIWVVRTYDAVARFHAAILMCEFCERKKHWTHTHHFCSKSFAIITIYHDLTTAIKLFYCLLFANDAVIASVCDSECDFEFGIVCARTKINLLFFQQIIWYNSGTEEKNQFSLITIKNQHIEWLGLIGLRWCTEILN